jgi:ferritin-like metal-binding protein YciE
MLSMKTGDNIFGERPGPGEVQLFFLDTLNTIYCAKAHLVERLPEIMDDVCFSDLKDAIIETISEMEKQLSVMDRIYDLLGKAHSFENCSSLISILDNAFMEIQKRSKTPEIRDLYLLSYLFIAESTESASFKILKVISADLKDKEVKKHLALNIKFSNADRPLLLAVTKRFVKSKKMQQPDLTFRK